MKVSQKLAKSFAETCNTKKLISKKYGAQRLLS